MTEKVHCIYSTHDGDILNGIAEYNGEKYAFERHFSDEKQKWSDWFYLTPLNDHIFNLVMENWEYWLKCLDYWQSQGTPPPFNYDLFSPKKDVDGGLTKKAKQAEKFEQNQFAIYEFFEIAAAKYMAKGKFSGDLLARNTTVEWSEVAERADFSNIIKRESSPWEALAWEDVQ